MSNTDVSSYFVKIYWIQFTLGWRFRHLTPTPRHKISV
jgi:hypothetical protein